MSNKRTIGIAFAVISLTSVGILFIYTQFVFPQPKIGEPEFILEYKTVEEIVDVIFGEAEMTVNEAKNLGIKGLEPRQAAEMIRIKYPKVVITKNAVKFTDKNGTEKKSIVLLETIPGKSWSSVNKSKNKKYLTINNVHKYNQKSESIENAELIMLSDEGEELWKMKHNLASIIPSPNGKYIIGTLDAALGDAPIYVFDEQGLIKELAKDDQAWNVDFSKDGSFFALTVITFDKTKKGIEKYKGHLIVIDEKGNELWKKENVATGESSFLGINISDDDIISLTTGRPEHKIYRFDKQGSLIEER